MPNNPFYNQPVDSNYQQMKSIFDMLRNSNNPQLLINNMMQSNPAFANIMPILNGNNVNYEKVFRNLCSQRGLNADLIIKNFMG